MRLNTKPERLRERAHQQRFGGSRQAGDQAMAAHEQRDQHLLDHLFLADDHFPDFADDLRADLLEAVNPRFQFRRIGNRCSASCA